MSRTRRHTLARALVVFVEAVLISWALIFLAEWLGWHWLSEAGGSVARATVQTQPDGASRAADAGAVSPHGAGLNL
jgi:hypothetical protein